MPFSARKINNNQPRTITMEKIFKTCRTCNIAKEASLEFFRKHVGRKDGLRSSCKPCQNIANQFYYKFNYENKNKDYLAAYNKKWRLENRERKAASDKNWQNKNPDKISSINRNYRARKNQAEGSHTAEDVANIISKQNNLCFWCNTKLEKIHIDHIIPLIKGGRNDASNLVASCPSCNCSKGAKLPEEFLAYQQQQITMSPINYKLQCRRSVTKN
jgi:5-methylcytosine-specific restriction endonuclease McrA